MGWQNDPVVGADSQPAAKSSGGGWQNDPVAGVKDGGGAVQTSKTPTYGADEGWGQYAGDIAYRAANTGSLGLLDYANAGVHAAEGESYGDALTKIQQQNDEWGANHPYAALAADVAGYGLGAGKFGVGGKIATKLGGSLLARAAGAGAENIGSTLVSDELKSQGAVNQDPGSLLKDLAISGTVGSLTGAIPGGKGKLADIPSPTADLKTATAAAFAPLKNAEFHPGDIGPAYDGAVSSISSGQKVKLDGDFKAKMSEISQEMADKYNANKPISADDIASYSQALRDNASGPLEQNVAKDLDNALHGAVKNANPTGTSQTGPQVSQAIKDANAAAEQKNASQNIDDWIKQAQSGKAGSVPDAINNKLDNNPGFFQSQPGLRDALTDAATPRGIGSKVVQGMAHPLADAAIGGTVTAGGNMLFGSGDPTTSILEGLATGAGGALVGHGFAQKRTNDLVAKLAAARHLNATGQSAPASAFKKGIPVLGPMATYAPRVGVGVGASNMFNDINQ